MIIIIIIIYIGEPRPFVMIGKEEKKYLLCPWKRVSVLSERAINMGSFLFFFIAAPFFLLYKKHRVKYE